jgi:hypothetical protein
MRRCRPAPKMLCLAEIREEKIDIQFEGQREKGEGVTETVKTKIKAVLEKE